MRIIWWTIEQMSRALERQIIYRVKFFRLMDSVKNLSITNTRTPKRIHTYAHTIDTHTSTVISQNFNM